MKKKVIVIRFGSSAATKADLEAVSKITNGSLDAAACPSPFGLISIFFTDLSPAEITDIYTKTAAEMGDTLPTITFESDGPVGYHFDPAFFDHFEGCNQAFDERFGTSSNECTLTLDELLDMVKAKGLSNFTEEELKRLKELSK